MKQKHLTLALILMLAPLSVQSKQRRTDDESAKRKNKSYNFQASNRIVLRLVPSGIFNRFGAGLPIGVGVSLGDNWAVNADIMIPFKTRVNVNNHTVQHISTDSKYRLELRGYLVTKKADKVFLVG